MPTTSGPRGCGPTARPSGSPKPDRTPTGASMPTTSRATNAGSGRNSISMSRTAPRAASGPIARRHGSPTSTGTNSTPTTARAGSAPSTATIVLDPRNREAHGLWSDGEAVWVVDGGRTAVFAYDLGSGDFLDEYNLAPANGDPRGIWSDGVTLWVSDHGGQAPLRLPPARTGGVRGVQPRARRGGELRGALAGRQQQPARHLVRRRRDVRRGRARPPRLQLQHARRGRHKPRLAHAQRHRHRRVLTRQTRVRSSRSHGGDGDDG